MALKRPTSLLVFGILSIVFGSLGLLGGLCNGVFVLTGFQEQMAQTQQSNAAQAKDPQQKELAEYQVRSLDMMQNTPFYKANLVGSTIFNLFLCVLLIVGGIGLMRVAPWGRSVSITYAVLSILSSLWAVVYSVFIMLPAMNAFLDHELEHAGPLLSTTIQFTRYGMYFAPVVVLCYFIYPGLLLFWMLRAPIVEAFRKGGVEAPGYGESYPPGRHNDPDDYDDRRQDRGDASSEGFTPK